MKADTHLQVQTLTGQIKQADADVTEAKTLRERAERNLELAQNNEAGAITRAADLRVQRDILAEATAAAIKRAGEADTGEEVIQSTPGEDQPAPPMQEPVLVSYQAECPHTREGFTSDGLDQCLDCGALLGADPRGSSVLAMFGDKPVLQNGDARHEAP